MHNTAVINPVRPKPPATSKEKGGWFASWFKFSGEFTLMAIAVILTLEGLFGWAGIGEQECLRIDSYLGFSLFPNKEVTWRREGFSRVRFNSAGMQDREYSKKKPIGTKRIAIVGDSYVEALQVDRSKNFCSLLENLLKTETSLQKADDIQVMNFGVQAHNLAQSYLYLKRTILQFAPDVVVVPYRTDATYLLPPDIQRGFLGARPNFFVDSKGNLIEDRTVQELWLKSGAAKRMKSTAWLRENSKTWGVFSTAAEAASNWKQSGGLLENFICSKQELKLPGLQAGAMLSLEEKTASGWTKTSKVGEDSIRATWPIANALITEMNELCNKHKCRMVVLRMPGVGGHISALETELLRKTARHEQIPFLDLTEQFHQELLKGEKLFFNTHMTEAGHKLVAERLSDLLKSPEYLSPSFNFSPPRIRKLHPSLAGEK